MQKTRSIIGATLGTVALVAVFSFAGAGAANADTPSTSTDISPSQSCWIDTTLGESLCVPVGDDLVAAVQEQDDVTIQVPSTLTLPGVSAATLKADASATTEATAATVIATSELFEDINYGGGTLVMTSSDGCDAGISSLVPYGWNDQASSFKSFNGCETKIWQNINYGGTHLGYDTNEASFGSLNDETSSWETE